MKISFADAVSRNPVGRYQILIVTLITAALVLDGIDLQVLPLVAPHILEEWGVDRTDFGWPLSAAIVGMGIGAVAGGWLGDRYGRRNMLVGSILLFGAATIAASAADSVSAMTLLRFIGGLGFGAAGPNGLALATEWMPKRLRTYVVSLVAIGTPAGTMAGAALVPAMVPELGWRGTYVVFGVLSVVLGFAILALIRESPSFLLGKGKAEKAHRHAAKVIDGPLELEPEHQQSVAGEPAGTKTGVFHRSNLRLTIGTALALGASTAVVYGFSGWSPIILKSSGFADSQLSGANFALGLVSVIGALISGHVCRVYGSRRIMALCPAATFLCVVALAFVVEGIGTAPTDAERWAVYSLIGLAGGVASIGVAATYSIMTMGYPVSCVSSGIGFGMLAGRLGGVSMSLAGGYLLDLGGTSVLPFFLTTAAFALLVSASAWIIDRHIQPGGLDAGGQQ